MPPMRRLLEVAFVPQTLHSADQTAVELEPVVAVELEPVVELAVALAVAVELAVVEM